MPFQKGHPEYRKNLKPSFYGECLNCKKSFKIQPYLIKRGGKKYCSYSCRLEYWRKTGILKGKPSWNKGKKEGRILNCKNCEKEFYVIPSQFKYRNPRYCSQKCYGRAEIWNRGLTKETDERVKKNAQILKGRKPTKYWSGKKRLHMSGSKHWFWKGGITEKNRLIRQSIEYKNWRRSVYIKDEYTCQECKQKHIDIVAHHIKPFSSFPEARFDVNNGKVLCRKCHARLELSLRQEAHNG